MAMNKAQTIAAFHNLLSLQVKNLCGNLEVEELRPKLTTSLFRFKTETPGLNYVIQTIIDTTTTAYTIDVAIVEESLDENNETKPELIDTKVFEVVELGMKDKGVKLVMKYIRGAIKAVVTNEAAVFEESEE